LHDHFSRHFNGQLHGQSRGQLHDDVRSAWFGLRLWRSGTINTAEATTSPEASQPGLAAQSSATVGLTVGARR
jgi:hypothetical protein